MDLYRQRLLSDIGIEKSEDMLTPYTWSFISQNKILTLEFLREFKEEIIWDWFSMNINLTEEIIRIYKDWLNWEEISRYQKVSDEFIEEFKDKFDWECLFIYNELSFSIIKKYCTRSSLTNIREFNVSHLNEYEIREIQQIIKFKNLFKKK